MRVLKIEDDGTFSLTKFTGGKIPSYAILSHTWEADDQEVIFKDLADGTGTNKTGHRKIRFCGEQARKDGLQYFWVDSCCIDKSSSAELSEAINSMFRWYRNAAKCYVYLSDVSTGDSDQHAHFSQHRCELNFRQSRWFTRGWTLQELLAPQSVEFFTREGTRLGNKKSLELQIHEITGITVQALQGSPLSQFSVTDRMSWAAKRVTSIEEDQAYCLLGIFDIHLPLIYGEGKENAFRRLRKEISAFDGLDDPLNRLPYAAEAPFNSNQRQHEPTCLENTRVDLLQDIQTWADGQDSPCIFWLNGLAGTGKSTIARTIARNYFTKQRLGASFFFLRGGGDVGHAGKFATSIAVQLANNIPTFRQHICDAMVECNDIANQSLRDQWHHLVFGPLSKLDGNCSLTPYVLVVDALDECNDDNSIRIILHLLAEARSLKRVRIFLTSRPEIPIRYGFSQMPRTEHQDFVLHNISPSIVDHDIYIFLEFNLRIVGQERSLYVGWPGEEVTRRLVQMASGLFIWAATACRFIRDGKRFAVKRLSSILKDGGSAVTAPEKHLNEIYTTVLKHSVSPEYGNEEKEEVYHMLRQILGSIVIFSSPLSTHALSRLLRVKTEEVCQTLEDLHSILDVPNDQARALRLHHPSFRDFLLDSGRCKDSNFWVDEKQAHQMLADSCIQLMSTSLKQDICGLDTPGVHIADVNGDQVEQCLPPEVQYACLYWVEHLQKGCAQLHDNNQVHKFLQTHFLHWLEALSWTQRLSEGIRAISSLESIVLTCDCPQLNAFIHDMKRFALYCRPAMEQIPLQAYYGALSFAPAKSIVRKHCEGQILRWMKKLSGVPEDWSASLQTLEGHGGPVLSVAFSHDSARLASASDDGTIKIWDASSGECLQTLEGHRSPVCTVAFSHDSARLASASYIAVKIWDASSGGCLQTLRGHHDRVLSVAFSPDSARVASASVDMTVKTWDASSGKCLQTLVVHDDLARLAAFSHDWARLASTSYRGLKIWDASSGECFRTLSRHGHPFYSVAFSHDSSQLVSSSDNKVRIWDTSSGECIQTLEDHGGPVLSVAFSHDSARLASASSNFTVKIWDASDGGCLQTLKGHSDWVQSVAFSHDSTRLASASSDSMVKIWDISNGECFQMLERHGDSVHSVTFSHDSARLVSASRNAVKIWDANSGKCLRTLEDLGHSVWAVVFSHDSARLASVSYSGMVKIWDASSGRCLWTLNDHYSSVSSVTFSHDSTRLASASDDGTIKIWDASSGECLQTIEAHRSQGYTVAFSQDSALLASGSNDSVVKIWSVSSGECLQTLEGHGGWIRSVAFSPDSVRLVSTSYYTVKVWDTGSGECLRTLCIGEAHSNISLDTTGSYLYTELGTIPLTPSVTNLEIPRYKGWGLSSDREWITYNSENWVWLPSEYRPSCSAVSGKMIGVGTRDGKVWICNFKVDDS